jgi:hypothetical protein
MKIGSDGDKMKNYKQEWKRELQFPKRLIKWKDSFQYPIELLQFSVRNEQLSVSAEKSNTSDS